MNKEQDGVKHSAILWFVLIWGVYIKWLKQFNPLEVPIGSIIGLGTLIYCTSFHLVYDLKDVCET